MQRYGVVTNSKKQIIKSKCIHYYYYYFVFLPSSIHFLAYGRKDDKRLFILYNFK